VITRLDELTQRKVHFVTLVLHFCYTVVTLLLHCCGTGYTPLTLLLQERDEAKEKKCFESVNKYLVYWVVFGCFQVIHAHTHIHTHTYTRTHARTHTHTPYTHTHTHIHTHTHTHTIHTHTHTHTRTHTHTHKVVDVLMNNFLFFIPFYWPAKMVRQRLF
jgi:hypothetical protein